MQEQTYTTTECSRMTGATLRMLQYWDESNLLSPEIIGNSRQYSAKQVLLVRVIRWLRGTGITIAMIRRMQLRDIHDDFKLLVVALTGRTPKWTLCLTDAEALKAATSATCSVVVIPLQDLRELMAAKAHRRAA